MRDEAGEVGRWEGKMQAEGSRKQTGEKGKAIQSHPIPFNSDAATSGAVGPKWSSGGVGARVPLHCRENHWRRGRCREVVESCCHSGSTGMSHDHENIQYAIAWSIQN